MKTLSMFSYFGGKAKLAPLICDLIDYKNTDTYIEMFGGACRVLLNKARHDLEIYNDSSAGLCAFVSMMSNQDTAHELIARLYETEYSQEQFDWALDIRNKVDDNIGAQISDELMRFFKYVAQKKKKCPHYQLNPEERAKAKYILEEWKKYRAHHDLFHAIRDAYKFQSQDTQSSSGHEEQGENKKEDFWDYVRGLLQSENETERLEAWKYAADLIRGKNGIEYLDVWDYVTDRPQAEIYGISEIDLAVATYVVYAQSRDAMGKYWTSYKYKSQEAYYRQIDRLYDVADRLEGVQVNQINALDYCRDNACILSSPDVFCYADPSYLNGEKDLGCGVYKHPSAYKDHEWFLDRVHNAKCKMIISNYDNELYNKYLRGWNKIEIPTKTSVGGKADNRRTEVLWYNYSI